jgi:hypothetical protein
VAFQLRRPPSAAMATGAAPLAMQARGACSARAPLQAARAAVVTPAACGGAAQRARRTALPAALQGANAPLAGGLRSARARVARRQPRAVAPARASAGGSPPGKIDFATPGDYDASRFAIKYLYDGGAHAAAAARARIRARVCCAGARAVLR